MYIFWGGSGGGVNLNNFFNFWGAHPFLMKRRGGHLILLETNRQGAKCYHLQPHRISPPY